MIKTLGTTIDWKNPDRAIGITTKVKLNFTIHGVFNIPEELRGYNKNQMDYKFSLVLLGQKLEGGYFVNKILTEDEQEKIQPAKGKKIEIDYREFETKINWEETKLKDNYLILEDIYKSGQIQFKKNDEDFKEEFLYQNKDLVFLENEIFKQKQCFVYLICEPNKDENELKKIVGKFKEVEEIDFLKPQIFWAVFNLEKFLLDDCQSISQRITFTGLESNYFQLSSPMYVKMEITSDYQFSKELKQKFSINLKKILEILFQQQQSPEQIISEQFREWLKDMRGKFDELMNNQKENIMVCLEKSQNKDYQNQEEEINQIVKTQFMANYDLKQWETELGKFIEKIMSEVYSVEDFSSVNMDAKDSLYNKVFCFIMDQFQEEIQEEKRQFLKDKGITQQYSHYAQAQYYSQIQKITQLSVQEHYLQLSNQYFVTNQKQLGWQSLMLAYELDDSLTDLVIQKLIEEEQFKQAENLTIKLMMSDKKFDYMVLLVLIFIEQKKSKESLYLIKYIKEKYNKEQYVSLLVMLVTLMTQENDTLINLMKEKLKFYFQEKPEHQDQENNLFNLRSILEEGFFMPEYLQEAVRKITKEKETEEEEVQEIKETNYDEFLISQAQNCITYNLRNSASLILKLVEDKSDIRVVRLLYQSKCPDDSSLETLALLEELHEREESSDLLIEIWLKLKRVDYLSEEVEDQIIETLTDNFQELSERNKFLYLFNFGEKVERQQDYQTALHLYQNGGFSNSTIFLNKRGKNLRNLGHLEDSLVLFKKANFLDKYNPEYLLNIFFVLQEIKQESKQILVLRNLMKMNLNMCDLKTEFIEVLRSSKFSNLVEKFEKQPSYQIDFNSDLFRPQNLIKQFNK